MHVPFKGCNSVLKLAEISAHAKVCPFKPPADLDAKVIITDLPI